MSAQDNPTLWVGRSYLHFVLPVPTLGGSELALLDRAICTRDGWAPVEVTAPGPVVSRAWEMPSGAELRLAVLSWYPAFLTLGPPGRSSRAARSARGRVADAVLRHGGFLVGDPQLRQFHGLLHQRWGRVVALQRQIEELEAAMRRRRCGRCGGLAGARASHCPSCTHRFTDSEDTMRDEARRRDDTALSALGSELDGLARGEGIFAGWPTPATQPTPVVPSLSPARERPRVVPHR